MADGAGPALAIEALVKTYGAGVTVGPISLEVKEGEFFSLLGPSGCGKTTTLRCVAGFETLTSGRILVAGKRIDDRPAHRRGIGLVFQDYALFPHLTIFENIAFGLRLRKLPKREIEERVERVLEVVSLTPAAQRYPAQISGGQQQRTAIARSLVLEPSLILLDEPLSNLDLKLRHQMRQELRRLQRQFGKTSVYVTHDQTEAMALSDRLAVLADGKVEQVGTPAEIYGAPRSRFVADFVGASNIVAGRVARTGEGGSTIQLDGGRTLQARATDAAPGAAVSIMVRPERIRLLAPGGEAVAENTLAATIADTTFLGEDLHLRLAAGDGLVLLTSIKNIPRYTDLLAAGRVDIAIDPQDVHVLTG
ncbi:MAG: ABC transporter ATP-binding protein [Alphaproteobacteria bacterium]